jgi:phytase-like protein
MFMLMMRNVLACAAAASVLSAVPMAHGGHGDDDRSREFMFVGSERGAFVAVYRLDGWNRPRFVQLLSTGQAPEGLLTIPSRNLFVTANEGDDQDGSISIFEGVPGRWDPSGDQPRIFSSGVDEPWGALSGLASGPHDPDVLYAVPDNALPSSIFSIHVGDSFARIRDRMPVTRGGTPVLFDLEGIAIDTSIERPRRNAGFWLASEGNASTTRNTLIQIDGKGEILREIFLPPDVDAPGGRVTSNGFEGVTVSSDGRYLLVAVQRPYRGETIAATGLPVLHTRIARYDLELEKWEAFFYPLESSSFTIGLSEIVLAGTTRKGHDVYAVIERDNQLAANGQIKRVYTFTLEGLAPEDIATAVSATSIAGSTVTKRLLRDVQPQFTPYEKVEGLAVTWAGDLWVALDNDGGEFESRLVRYRKLLH